jgi:polysaccharide export outer membrane protein
MKTWIFRALAWLALPLVAWAQGGNDMPPADQGMGPSPVTPHELSKPLPAVPPSMLQAVPGSEGNSTALGFSNGGAGAGNGTLSAPGTLSYGQSGMLQPPSTPGGNVSIPNPAADTGTGNATALKLPPGAATSPMPEPPPSLTQVTMPNSMDTVDNQHKLATGDRIYYEVVQDRDQPKVLMVDEKGMVDVPYLGQRDVSGKTLREMAYMLQKELESTLYYHATVLAVPYSAGRTRQVVYVMGYVTRPGPIAMPADDVLTVWSAIWDAGGITPQADASRVTLLRRDPKNPKSMSKIEINVEDIYTKGIGDVAMQPGDSLLVPPKGEATGFVTITGAVRSPGMMPLPVGSNVTVSQAILQAGGFTEWGDDVVKLVHYEDSGKAHESWVDVGTVLNNGKKEKDVKLQSGDMIIVSEKWIKFGF